MARRQTAQGRSEGAFTTLYGTYFTERAELEAMFSYGRDHHKNIRRIDLGGLERRAGSEHYSDVYAATLEGRYHFNIDDLKIEPFVSMRYSRLNIAGFRETGAGDLDLLIDRRSVDAFSLTILLQ